jgi:ribosome-associated toxin RatA of RatAB toxin-antitoxin module
VHTGNSIIIAAPRAEIFGIVSDLGRWPERLPHYRYVRITGRDGQRDIVEMSAFRGRIPVSWVSAYEANRDLMELRFEHLTKWTKGMTVVWTLTPTRDATRVEISHHLKFRVPLLGWFAEPIIANFISHIASRTLREFKGLIEAGHTKAAGAVN